MEVILLERITNLGNLGDKVNVKPGYGRNFLVPEGKAVFATDSNVVAFEARRAELEKKAAEKLAQAQARADQLNTVTIHIEANASEEGKLFGSVGVNEISHSLTEAGHEVEKKEISLPEGPIHQIGEYNVAVQVHSDVVAEVKVQVTAAK